MAVKIRDIGKVRVATYPVDNGNYEAIVTDYENKITVKECGESEAAAIDNAIEKFKVNY